jgi:hypothetical protein
MRTVETTATVAPDGTLTVQVPPDVTPGTHQIVLVIDDWPHEGRESQLGAFPVISVGAWPPDLSLRRENIYGDAGVAVGA